MNNQSSSALFVFPLPNFRLKQDLFGGYVQDDFHVKPRFMLNLGLRYNYGQVPNEINGHFFNLDGPSGPFLDPNHAWNADFSPRLGFAWTVDQSQKTVVRGGVGMFYIPQNMFAGPVEIVKFSAYAPSEATLIGSQLQSLVCHIHKAMRRLSPWLSKLKLSTIQRSTRTSKTRIQSSGR